jgi:hypothetical protein
MDYFKAKILHPKLSILYDYWDSIRADKDMPCRRDLDPLDIPGLLPNIILLDVEDDPLRFRFRLYGTAVSTIRGRDLTGHYMDEPDVSRITHLTYPSNLKVVETRQPHIVDAPYPLESGVGGYFYRMALPFSDNGSSVTMIMVGFYQEARSLLERRPAASVA